jgi:hypothetical protein
VLPRRARISLGFMASRSARLISSSQAHLSFWTSSPFSGGGQRALSLQSRGPVGSGPVSEAPASGLLSRKPTPSDRRWLRPTTGLLRFAPVLHDPGVQLFALEQRQSINLVVRDIATTAVQRAASQAEVLRSCGSSHPLVRTQRAAEPLEHDGSDTLRQGIENCLGNGDGRHRFGHSATVALKASFGAEVAVDVQDSSIDAGARIWAEAGVPGRCGKPDTGQATDWRSGRRRRQMTPGMTSAASYSICSASSTSGFSRIISAPACAPFGSTSLESYPRFWNRYPGSAGRVSPVPAGRCAGP